MGRMFCLTLYCVALFAGSSTGQSVVVNNNLKFVEQGRFSGDYAGSIDQTSEPSPFFGDPTGARFEYDGNSITGTSSALDVGSDWYLVSEGEAFGFSSLASGQFTPIISDLGYSTAHVGTGDFYLGVATTGHGLSEPCDPHSFFCRNVFGWVHLSPLLPGIPLLEAVSSAVAYDSLGIIVGTTRVVPEPATLLIALGFVVAIYPARGAARGDAGRGQTRYCDVVRSCGRLKLLF